MKSKYNIAFDENSHTYKVDGVVKQSVTQIMLSAGLMDWVKGIHEYYAERGSLAHLACHLFDTVGLDMDTVDERIRNYVNAYTTFRKENKVKVVASEVMMYDPELDCCGTLDKLLSWGGKLVLVDLKSNTCPDTAEVQLAEYERMVLKDLGYEVDDVRVLVLKDDGRYSLSKSINTRRGRGVFKAANVIAKWKGETK